MSQLQPANTTPGDLAAAALQLAKVVGLGQTAAADQLTIAVQHLQWMMQMWERERWLVYHLVTFGITCDGSNSYTVGPGGQLNTDQVSSWTISGTALPTIASAGTGYAVNDTLTLTGGVMLRVTSIGTGGAITGFALTGLGIFPSPLPTLLTQTGTSGVGVNFSLANMTWLDNGQTLAGVAQATSVRPSMIESCFCRQLQNTSPNQIDYPLMPLQSREDYNRVALKSLVSFPKVFWYNANWPLGELHVYPVPNAAIYGIYISVRQQLPFFFASLTTPIQLPYEYYYAIISNLALRIMPVFGKRLGPGDTLGQDAANSLKVLRGTNLQIAALSMPGELARPGLYNVFSDQNY